MKFCFKSLFCFCAAFVACFLLFGARAAEAQCVAEQTHKLLAEDGAAEDGFGLSVAISGTTAIVGAFWDDDNGTDSGSAYVFDTTTGQLLHKLLAMDGAAGDRFGVSVAISGTIALVGADENAASGSAYVFDLSTGQQLRKLRAADGAAGDIFGNRVAISGTTAIIAAPWDDDNGSQSGSAYLFDVTTGEQLFKLLPNDGAGNDFFGISVAISGSIAVVGAWHDDDNGENSGSAYLFDTVNGQQLRKLLPNDGVTWDLFCRVGVSGNTAIVGAAGDDDNGASSGSAYLFDVTTGEQLFKLLPDDGAADEEFGNHVAINGNVAIVGAAWDDDNGAGSGSAYLFDTTTGQQIAKLLPNDGAARDNFGMSVGISGTNAIAGAWQLYGDNGNNSGSAYLFVVSCADVVVCDSFQVTLGTLDSGGVADLAQSDDQYLILDPEFLSFRYQLEYTVDATSPSESPSGLEFSYESKTTNLVGTVEQKLELFNYDSGQFETVDTRLTSAKDTVVSVTPVGDPTRFVEAGTNAMQARISYQNSLPFWVFSLHNLYPPYRVRVDHIFWTITP